MSTSSKSAILSRQATSGWEVLVHHLLTVDGLTPSCSESHLLVRFFSKRTIFILFTSSIFIAVLCYKDSDFVSRYAKVARLFSLYLCFFTNLSELSFGFVRLPIRLLSFVVSVKLCRYSKFCEVKGNFFSIITNHIRIKELQYTFTNVS